jgi:hypothetical protein
MHYRFSKIVRVAALISSAVLFLACIAASAQTIMNGKEVRPYTGQIVSHNDRTGEIVIKTENSTGHWRLHRHVTVLSGRERLELSDIWGKTRLVQVWVSKDGEVQRITVLEWKK